MHKKYTLTKQNGKMKQTYRATGEKAAINFLSSFIPSISTEIAEDSKYASIQSKEDTNIIFECTEKVYRSILTKTKYMSIDIVMI
jgi:hypothetical protein